MNVPVDDVWHPANLVALGALAAETGNSVDELATKLGDNVLLDDVGMRVCTRAAARSFIAERSAAIAQQQARETARRAALAANDPTKEVRARVRALQRQGDATGEQRYDDIRRGI